MAAGGVLDAEAKLGALGCTYGRACTGDVRDPWWGFGGQVMAAEAEILRLGWYSAEGVAALSENAEAASEGLGTCDGRGATAA